MIKKTLAILAGGKAAEWIIMIKHWLTYKEKPFIEHIINSGKDFGEIIVISNNKYLYNVLPVKVFNDIFRKGPLSEFIQPLKCKVW